MTDYLTRHVRAILFVTFALVLLGLYSLVTLPVSIFPPLTIPRVMIAIEGGDAPAESIIVSVTRPLEQSLSTVPNLQLMQSHSTRGGAGFTLTFQWGTDVMQALQQVNARISEVRSQIPSGMRITAERLNPTIFPILNYSITSPTRSLADLRILALYTIRPRVASLPGVARVMVDGGEQREYQVTISPDRLAAYHVSAAQVTDALSKVNAITAVGNYDNHYLRHLVLVNGLLNGANTIESVVVDVKGGVPVTVGDVAAVAEGIQRQTVLATGTGTPAVLMNIVRQPTGNTIEVVREVRDEIQRMRSALPADVHMVPFYDQSEIVQESESSVVESILVGGALALVVLLLFLGNLRTALTALSILPLTLAVTFGVMRALGLDLNIMTLGALAVALGLVIDDSIVVVEHIYATLENGHSREHAIPTAIKEITRAMFASSICSMVTFLPLVFLPGVTGNFFSALAITMISTLTVSLGLALIVCPTIARWTLPARVKQHGAADEHARLSRNGAHQQHPRGYERISLWCLHHRIWIILIALPVAAGAFWLMSRLQSGFMPEFDEGAFVMDYRMPPGTSLAETDRVMTQVEAILAKEKGVSSWSRLSGALSGSGLEICPENQGDVLVHLTRGSRPSVDDITADVRTRVLAQVPNIELNFAQILGDLIGDLSGTPSPIEVKVFGPDMATLRPIVNEVGKRISSIPGVVDEADGIVDSGPQAQVRVDPVRAAEVGLSPDTVTAAMSVAMDGAEVGSVIKGDILEPIRVKYPGPAEPQLDSLALSSLPIVTPTGQTVPLSSVAEVRVTQGSPDLNRENQRQLVSVTARLDHLDLGTAIQRVKAKLADLALPPGCSIEYGGLYKSQQESFRALTVVLLLAISFVLSILIITFRSFRVASALLIAAVLSLSGVAVALFVTATPLNISSFTGAIMIVGIVTENGVLLFDEVERLRERESNLPLDRMLAAAGQARLRPILMTTFAAILTLLPLSFGIGAGAAMQKPLAVAVIGGLLFSTFFTLILAPVIYLSFSRAQHRIRQRGSRQ